MTQLESTPTRELVKLGGSRTEQLWRILKRCDRVAPQRPTIRTCCCGTTIVALAWLWFSVTIWTEYATSKPTVTVSNQMATTFMSAPLPQLAIGFCEYPPVEVISKRLFEKYLRLRMRYRRYQRPDEHTLRKMNLEMQKDSGAACGLAEVGAADRCLLFCSNAGEPAYSAPVSVRTSNDSHIEEYVYTERVQNNLTLEGMFGEPIFTFFDVSLDILDTDWSNATDEFWRDSQGLQRRFALDVWVKFQSEDWSNGALKDGEWSFAFFDKIPQNSSDADAVGLHYEINLMPNIAHVGPRRPIRDGVSFFGEGSKDVPWFSWESHFARAGGTHSFPYKAPYGELLEIIMRVGRNARDVTVDYPPLFESVIQLGAAYEFALGLGVTVSFIVWLVLQADCKRAAIVAMNCYQGEFEDDATPQSRRPGDEDEQKDVECETEGADNGDQLTDGVVHHPSDTAAMQNPPHEGPRVF